MRYVFAFIFVLFLMSSAAVADPLNEAVKAGDAGLAKQLLDTGAAATTPDSAGEPPLLVAALTGNAAIVTLLLDRGVGIESRNKGGLTALHAAAYGGKLEVVELLVANGADVNDTSNYYKMSPLHAAAEEGHADIVAFLVAHKADVEAKERNGYSPLTQAGWREHWDTAALLLKAGATCQPADLVGEWLYTECTKRK